MAVFKGNKLSGSISNMVYYVLNGKQVARSRAYDVKQTAATKASARDFGSRKRISAGLRRGLSLVYAGYKKPEVMYAMDRAAGDWLKFILPQIKSTDLNNPYFDSLTIEPQFQQPFILGERPVVDWNSSGKVTINIPALHFAALKIPKNTVALSFSAVVSGVNIYKDVAEYHEKSQETELLFENQDLAASTLEVQINTEIKNYLFLAYLQISYKTSKGRIKENQWNPVMVVGSCFRVGR